LVPNSKPSDQSHKYGQATVDIKLHIRRAFITDDFKNMMISYLGVVKGVDDSDDLPHNVSKFKKDRGIQLEAATEEEDAGDRQGMEHVTKTRSSTYPSMRTPPT
jgi:HSP90 family molecular chaperone